MKSRSYITLEELRKFARKHNFSHSCHSRWFVVFCYAFDNFNETSDSWRDCANWRQTVFTVFCRTSFTLDLLLTFLQSLDFQTDWLFQTFRFSRFAVHVGQQLCPLHNRKETCEMERKGLCERILSFLASQLDTSYNMRCISTGCKHFVFSQTRA